MTVFSKTGCNRKSPSRRQGSVLDLERLENVRKGENKTSAACPACRENGSDGKGNHLVIFPDGRFACVLFQGQAPLAKAHRRRVLRLTGVPGSRDPYRGLFGVAPTRVLPSRLYTPPPGGIVLEPPPRTVVREDGKLKCLILALARADVAEVAVAVKTTSDGRVRLLTLYAPPATTAPAIIDVEAVSEAATIHLLEGLVGKTLVVHGAQNLIRLLARWHPNCRSERMDFWCTWTAVKLLSNGRDLACELEAVLQKHLHVPMARDTSFAAQNATRIVEPSFAHVADTVRHLLALKERLTKNLETNQLKKAFSLERQLLPVTHALNENGWRINSATLRAERDRISAKLSVLEAASARPLQTRLAMTDAWLKRLDPADERLRCTYHPLGTVTGRYSCTHPNLQGVPRGRLRAAFCAAKGHALVIGDLSQIELRIAALVSGDRAMLNAFRRGVDLHRITAAAVLYKDPAEVNGEDRQVGKVTNFGLIYGQGIKGFVRYAGAQAVELTEKRAEKIRNRFFEAFPGIARWHQKAWESILPGTVVLGKTVLGRRRYLRSDARDWDQFQALINYTVQGSAAELFKLTLVELHPKLKACRARLIGVVHDEIIVEAPAGVTRKVASLLQGTFEKVYTRTFNRACVHRFQRSLQELFVRRPACEVQTSICANWAAKS